MKSLSNLFLVGLGSKTSAIQPKDKPLTQVVGDQQDTPLAGSDRRDGKGPRIATIATIGTRRKVNPGRWKKLIARRRPPRQFPDSPRAPQKMGIRLPGFRRHSC